MTSLVVTPVKMFRQYGYCILNVLKFLFGLGLVHIGRSYLDCRENISTGQIMLFCSHGEMFSRLPGKVSCCDVDFVKCKQKVFPLSGKIVFIYGIKMISVTEISPVSKRDLGTRENFSSHMNATQLFILFRDLHGL